MAGPQHSLQPPVITVNLKPPLLSLADAERLDPHTLARLLGANAGRGRLGFSLAAFQQLRIERAEGPFYLASDGRRILDCFGGAGTLTLGHAHPRIAAARRRFHQERSRAVATALLSPYAAALVHNLAAIAPGHLDTVLLAGSAGQAMGTAIALAERAQRDKRGKILWVGDGISGGGQGTAAGHALRAPFGDIAAVEQAVADDPTVGIVVAETIDTTGVVEARDGFWPELRALCDRHGMLWVADETGCAVGRTGRFFAFEHEGVAPDIVTIAEGLSGGSAVAATIARRTIHARARDNGWAPLSGDAGLAEIGEGCCAAVEALHVLYDDGLMENAARLGDRLTARLEEIAARHPQMVRQVRGRGLMAALELHDLGEAMPFGLRHAVAALQGRLDGSLSGFVSALLLRDYDVLTGCCPGRNAIRLEPPLIVEREHVDRVADALDDLLSRGAMRILADVVKLQAAGGPER